jgi:hypothetical protein
MLAPCQLCGNAAGSKLRARPTPSAPCLPCVASLTSDIARPRKANSSDGKNASKSLIHKPFTQVRRNLPQVGFA